MDTCVTAIANIVLAVSAATGAVVAIVGLRTWRRELRGRTDFDLARRVMLAVYELRNEFRHVRNVFTPDSFDTGYEQLNRKASQLDAALLEAEVLWGDKLRPAKEKLKECLDSWRTALGRYSQSVRKNIKLSGDEMKSIDATLYADGEDELGRKLEQAVCGFEEVLQHHLGRARTSPQG